MPESAAAQAGDGLLLKTLPFNESNNNPTGGNSLIEDLNVHYEVQPTFSTFPLAGLY